MTLLPAIDYTIKALVYRSCFDHVSELLLDYRADAESGLLTPDRLRGFVQGIWCAGYLRVEDFCDVDAMIDSAIADGL